MALASWMNHEESRATEMRRILAREQNGPIFIRAEKSNPMALINNHNLIANNPQLTPRYLAAQEQEISNFEDMLRLLGDDSIHACSKRCNTPPHNLNIKEYHFPQRLREALNRTPRYKQSMLRLKVNWIGLKLSPPLLQGMLEGRKEE